MHDKYMVTISLWTVVSVNEECEIETYKGTINDEVVIYTSYFMHQVFVEIRSDHSKEKTSFADELVLLSHIISTLFWTQNNCVC